MNRSVLVSRTALLGLAICLVCDAPQGLAFETGTHDAINRSAAAGSPVVDSSLRNNLGLIRGLQEPLVGRLVVDWIGLGGVAEDQLDGSEFFGALTRSARHFHAPRLPWDRSGLDIALLPRFESSVRWAQLPDQGLTGRASWKAARTAFFNAATGTSDSGRQQAYADAFRIVGQLMHLVADLAQPSHTRNDSHPLGDDFEKFMASTQSQSLIAGFKTFDPSILQVPTGDAVAKIPVARIWDTDRYDGSNPPDEASSATFGLAEFSSANFFSPDTISHTAYADPVLPLPALNLLDLASIEPYLTGENRPYRGKSGAGVRVERMVAEGTFFRFLPPFVHNVVLDDLVFQTYAAHLLPRAIGYSAGLLDYFFRGRIEIAPPARFAYGLAAYQPGNAGAFTKLRFKVRNATPNEATGSGQMIAVAQYRRALSGADLIDNPHAEISSQLFFAVSQPLTAVALTESFQEFTFDFGQSPIPTNSADLFLTVVYKGRLGLEDDAVMVGGKNLFEPHAVDSINVSDWECLQGTPYHVGDLTAYPPYDPSTQSQRDVDHDHVQDLFGPAFIPRHFLKLFDLAQAAPLPSEANFDLRLVDQAPAQYGRVILLQDQASFGAVVFAPDIVFIPSGLVQTNTFDTATLPGVYNDVVLGPAGELVRRVSSPVMYRGLVFQNAFLLATPGTFPCIPQTQSLPPDVTQIEGAVPAE